MARPRVSSGQRTGLRGLLVIVLVVATVGAAGYFLVLRNGAEGATGDFASAHQRVVAAARAVPGAATEVHRFLELDRFNASIDHVVNEMNAGRGVFDQLARSEEREERDIAAAASEATQRATTATNDFRKAIAFTNRLVEAQAAQKELDDAVAELDHQASAWEQL
jgi:hypothetical protein